MCGSASDWRGILLFLAIRKHSPQIDPVPLAEDRTWTAEEVLEALPHGVVIVDAGGDLVHANPAAKKLVAGLGGSEVRRCSDLFECRVADGPCARTCLAERAAASDE